MRVPVLCAVTGVWEAPLVAGLADPGCELSVVRRCADLAELTAAALTGTARAAIVSADLPHLDADSLARLRSAGLDLVALVDPADRSPGLRATALGVRHVLDADASPAEVAAAVHGAVRRIPSARTDSAGDSRSGHPRMVAGQLIAVWGPAGAPGRTTLAVTLAAELAALGQRVLVADADTHAPSLAQTLGLLEEASGLAAAVRAAGRGALDAAELARYAPLVAPRLRVLTGLPRPDRWPELRPGSLDLVWQCTRAVAEWTVLDCAAPLETDEELCFDTEAPRRNGATLSALAAADVVLAVGSADPVGLKRLVHGLAELAELLPRGRAPIVVVTKVRRSAVGSQPERQVRDAVRRHAGVATVVLVPDDREACDAALLNGRPLTAQAPSSPARRAVAEFARQVVGSPAPRRRRHAGRRAEQ